MTPARVFALLFVAAFFGASLVDGAARTALGFVLVAGVVAICFGLLHPRGR